MSKSLNNFPFFGTQGIHNHERKARIAGEYRRRHPIEYDPHYVRYGMVLFNYFKVNSKGDTSHIGFWGRVIDAMRRLPSSTVGQSADDANVVLQSIRRHDNMELPNLPRVRQPAGGNALAIRNGDPQAGASQALEVYHGPFQGSVRDPSRDFPLVGRNRIIQDRNPAEHREVLEAIKPRRSEKPGRSLANHNYRESGFLDSRVPRDSNIDMNNLNPGALRNIITDWTAFKINHPVGAKVVKYTGWLLAASATTGGSVLLSTEISKLLRANDRNITENEIQWHITNFTEKFDTMIDESMKEFDKKPNPGIFDIYFDPLSRVKRNGKTMDFQFDFARVPPLPTPKKSLITPNITNQTVLNTSTSFSNFSDIVEEITSENPNLGSEEIENLEELPRLEKPFKNELPLRFSLILILVGAVTIVILAIIISCCFCYGCKSRERRYMNRDTVRANNQKQTPHVDIDSQIRTPVSSRETKSSQAPTSNLPNESFENDSHQIGLFNDAIQERFLPSIIGPSVSGQIGNTGQRRLVPYY